MNCIGSKSRWNTGARAGILKSPGFVRSLDYTRARLIALRGRCFRFEGERNVIFARGSFVRRFRTAFGLGEVFFRRLCRMGLENCLVLVDVSGEWMSSAGCEPQGWIQNVWLISNEPKKSNIYAEHYFHSCRYAFKNVNLYNRISLSFDFLSMERIMHWIVYKLSHTFARENPCKVLMKFVIQRSNALPVDPLWLNMFLYHWFILSKVGY